MCGSLVSTEEKFGFLAEGDDIDVAALVVEPVETELPQLDQTARLGHLKHVGLVGGVLHRIVHSHQNWRDIVRGERERRGWGVGTDLATASSPVEALVEA